MIGVDVSFWQDANSTPQQIDWVQCRNSGAAFAFIRAGQNTWTDEDFIYNWQGAKLAGLPRGAYWYLDNRSTGASQAERFYNFVRATGDTGELPMVIDYEHRSYLPTNADGSTNKGRMRQQLKDALEYLAARGVQPMVYTSPGYWQEFGSVDGYWARYPLWIAHYYVTDPTVPAPWEAWAYWQFTDKGDGLAYGMESKQVDLNRASVTLPPPVEPPGETLKVTIGAAGYAPAMVELEKLTNSV